MLSSGGSILELINEPNSEPKPRFSNRDLLIIAVLSGIGGVMSSYVSYLGNLLNKALGVPFGAGQFVSGLHVFWIILAVGLVRKPGAGTIAGILKGVIEFLAGSPHGVIIIVVSLTQGIMVDLVLLLLRRYSLASLMIAGALATATNVIVFQMLFFSGAPLVYIVAIAGVAAISGMLLAGSFGYSVLNIIIQARPFRSGIADIPTNFKNKKLTALITTILFIAFAGGSIYYYISVYESPWSGPQGSVTGLVDKELIFRLSDFKQDETTIRAELKGQFTNIPEQNYSGIPVKIILDKAKLKPEATKLIVTANDGYKVEFNIQEVLVDDKMLLIQEDNNLRLIAGNYEGRLWVRNVNHFIIE